MAVINKSGKSVKINKQGIGKSYKIYIRKLEVRKLQRHNDNTHVTALSAGKKKQNKTFINRWNFYKVRKTIFEATCAIPSHEKVLVGLDMKVGNE